LAQAFFGFACLPACLGGLALRRAAALYENIIRQLQAELAALRI